MISPDIHSLGGISSVVKMYCEYRLYNGEVIYLASYKKRNILFQSIFYPLFIIKYIFILLFWNNIKLVHIHTASRGSFFRKLAIFHIAKLFNKKVILHIHGAKFDNFFDTSSGFIKKMIINVLNKSDLVLVLSKEWQRKILKICENGNIKILYNPTVIKPTAIGNKNVLFMGRLGERKGVYDIIEAAKYVESDAIFHLYGDGKIEKPTGDNVKIHGWVSGEKKDEVFKNAAMLILPSYSEGLPISILEGMACGLPIIATPVGGIPEAVENGINGFLIEPGDCKALSEKIDLLLKDKELREKMGTESKKTAKEKFDVKIVLKNLGEIYDSLL